MHHHKLTAIAQVKNIVFIFFQINRFYRCLLFLASLFFYSMMMMMIIIILATTPSIIHRTNERMKEKKNLVFFFFFRTRKITHRSMKRRKKKKERPSKEQKRRKRINCYFDIIYLSTLTNRISFFQQQQQQRPSTKRTRDETSFVVSTGLIAFANRQMTRKFLGKHSRCVFFFCSRLVICNYLILLSCWNWDQRTMLKKNTTRQSLFSSSSSLQIQSTDEKYLRS